jgi:hypothetical protein
MVLPSSLLEEEEELLSVGILRVQPSTRAPCATLYCGGQGYNGHKRPEDTRYTPNRTCCRRQRPLTFSLIALDGTSYPYTLYFLHCELTSVMSGLYLCTMRVGKPPLCTLSS